MFIPNLLSSADSGGAISLPTRIAIVEDEPDLRDAVAEYLGANGYDVVTAESADAMRQLVETETFDLAILDIAMPGEDGLSLGRWLRSQMSDRHHLRHGRRHRHRPHRRAGARRRRLCRQALRTARTAGPRAQRAASRAAPVRSDGSPRASRPKATARDRCVRRLPRRPRRTHGDGSRRRDPRTRQERVRRARGFPDPRRTGC